MFTGLVEERGTVAELTSVEGAAVLRINASAVLSDLALGDSVNVNGCCLTAVEIFDDGFSVDVMPESLRRTALGDLVSGTPLNLERAVTAHARLGGHIVQGHVDGVGEVVSRTPGPRWDDIVIAVPENLARYIAEKGSIAIDGVSLTVTQVSDSTFGVSLIPTTLEVTTLGTLGVGSKVNLEVDVIAKYVERLLGAGVTQSVFDGSETEVNIHG